MMYAPHSPPPTLAFLLARSQLWSNRLAFLTAIANAIAGAFYACKRLLVLRSYSGADASSDHTSASEREQIRKVMDAAPSKRSGLPFVQLHSNIDFYRQKHIIARHLSFQLRRHECLHSMGRLCTRRDYSFPDDLTFKPCAERPLRMAQVPLVPDSVRDPDRPGHFLKYQQVKALIAEGKLDPRAVLEIPSSKLKVWSKANDLTPSPGQLSELASQALGSADLSEEVEKFFSIRRMSRFLKAEEAREALADPSSERYLIHVAERLMTQASAKVVGLASPYSLEDYQLVLTDPRIDLSSRGKKRELQERLFVRRAHVCNMLQLSLSEVERVPDAAEQARDEDDDPLACAVCLSTDASDANPILKCDGVHDVEVGYHMQCLPAEARLDEVPDNDWFCPMCREKGFWEAAERCAERRLSRLSGKAWSTT